MQGETGLQLCTHRFFSYGTILKAKERTQGLHSSPFPPSFRFGAHVLQHTTSRQSFPPPRSPPPPFQVEETVASIKAVPVNAQAAAKQKADELVAYVKNIPDTVSKAAKVWSRAFGLLGCCLLSTTFY